MRIAVLIPCYNAAGTIGELVARLSPFVPLQDIFVVDDGSLDDSSAAVKQSGARLIVHARNRGKGEALKTGFDAVLARGYDGVVTLDADLQHLPEHLPDFLRQADRFDILIGTRAYRLANMPFLRWLTNHLTSLVVSWLSGQRVRDSQSGYRYLSARALSEIPLSTVRYDMESEQLIRGGRMGLKIGQVPIATVYRGSASYIHPLVDTGRFIRMAWRNLRWKPDRATGGGA